MLPMVRFAPSDMLTSAARSTPVKLAVLPEPSAMVPPDQAAVSFHALPLPSQVPDWAEAEEMASREVPAVTKNAMSWFFVFIIKM